MKVYTFRLNPGCVEYLHADDGSSRPYYNGDTVLNDGHLSKATIKRLADFINAGTVVVTETEPEGTGGPAAKNRRKETT